MKRRPAQGYALPDFIGDNTTGGGVPPCAHGSGLKDGQSLILLAIVYF